MEDKIIRILQLVKQLDPSDYDGIFAIAAAMSRGVDEKAAMEAGNAVRQAAGKEPLSIDEEGGSTFAV